MHYGETIASVHVYILLYIHETESRCLKTQKRIFPPVFAVILIWEGPLIIAAISEPKETVFSFSCHVFVFASRCYSIFVFVFFFGMILSLSVDALLVMIWRILI